jgi:hypothetical protein
MSALLELAERVASESGSDNALDVLVEIALFQPDEFFESVRSNAAGTKCIFTTPGGNEVTHRASDWTMNRPKVAAALRALSAQEGKNNG